MDILLNIYLAISVTLLLVHLYRGCTAFMFDELTKEMVKRTGFLFNAIIFVRVAVAESFLWPFDVVCFIAAAAYEIKKRFKGE